jgi:regulator of sigma E protease
MTPPPGSAESAAPDKEPNLGEWLRSNGPVLAIIGALFVYLYIKFDSDGLWAIGKAALGLGFVIFVHELGHFLVAKWCDVHVTVFSIGFGPPIPGCTFKWGETTYKLALFPLGGYVQMVGQVDGDEASDGSDEDPRSYRNKSVGQRMAIISAGVVMNVILAIICFVVVFQGPGKDRKAAVVSAVDPGSPAYRAGIRTGAIIDDIAGIQHPYFEDLMVTVMGTDRDEPLKLAYHLPGGKKTELQIVPEKTKTDSRPVLGITPAYTTQLEPRGFANKLFQRPAFLESAARRATPPLEFGDLIVATTDPANPDRLLELPPDRYDGPHERKKDQRDYFEFERRMQLLADRPVTLQVERTDAEGRKERKTITVPPAFHQTLGARMEMGQITALRKGGPGDNGGVQARERDRTHEGDVILRVEVREPDGSVTRWTSRPEAPMALVGALFQPDPLGRAKLVEQALARVKDLDPMRLPDELRQWAQRMQDQGKADARKVKLQVKRHNQGKEKLYDDAKEVELIWDAAYQDNTEVPIKLSSPLSIPGLGIAYQVKTTVVAARSAADGADPTKSLRVGDVITKVRYEGVIDEEGKKDKGSWSDALEPEQWARMFLELQQPRITLVEFQVKRGDATVELSVQPQEVKDWPRADRGFLLATDVRRQRADGFFEAIGLGLKDTKNNMQQVYQNLRGMITGRISVENLGGPVTIARVAYYFAGLDFWEFIFFLGLISVNLAVINFLPIPVLDGGHMVFLLYEKIRGKPASEGVRVGATYAGLLLLASLMIFVLYLDIKRLL